MRFMLFMKPPLAPTASEEDWAPPPEAVGVMQAFNDEMTRAGVLLALDGLHRPERAVRVSFDGPTPTVTDGPFAETKEVIGGYWIIDVPSQAEAVEWATRCPVGGSGSVIEVRQIFEIEDFPPDVREAFERAQGGGTA